MRLKKLESGSDDENVNKDVYEIREHDISSEADDKEEYQWDEADIEVQNEQEHDDEKPPKNESLYEKNRFKWSSKSFISQSRTQKYNVLRVPTLRR